MEIRDIPIPDVYTRESADFRVLRDWFVECLEKIAFDHVHFYDLYDPLRIKEDLLWLLADTMGYKFDSRLPTSFNRLVLVYFMSMIRNKGSKDGVTLAAETNLAQFNLLRKAKEKVDSENDDILYNRLEDTSIPVNSVVVTPYTRQGYIDVVYFSSERPIDACIEYVRPLGMYLFQHAGVRLDARTRISIDARLTNEREVGMSFGPTQIGHYSREDYARMQKMLDTSNQNWGKGARVRMVTNWSAPVGWDKIYRSIVNTVADLEVISNPREHWVYYVIDELLLYEYQISKVDSSVTRWHPIGTLEDNGFITSTRYQAVVPDPAYWDGYRVLPGAGNLLTEEAALAMLPKPGVNDAGHTKREVWRRNVKYEDSVAGGGTGEYMSGTDPTYNPAARALYNLQLSNNEEVVKSLIDPFFSLGYGPHDISTRYPDNYLRMNAENYPHPYYVYDPEPYPGTTWPSGQNPGVPWPDTKKRDSTWNLRYDRYLEEALKDWSLGVNIPDVIKDKDGNLVTIQSIEHVGTAQYLPDAPPAGTPVRGPAVTPPENAPDIYTVESGTIVKPVPRVNPKMAQVGDAISMNPDDPNQPNTVYTYKKHQADDGVVVIKHIGQ